MTASAMYEFFISYSRYDSDFARAVSESFARLGVPVWMAEEQLLIEGRKRLEDREVLRDILTAAASVSRRCLVLLTPGALDSEWVMGVEIPQFVERERAAGRGVVWPLIVGSHAETVRSRWPAALAEVEALECHDPADVDTVIRDLCRAAGLTVERERAPLGLSSPRSVTSRHSVKTERRSFAFTLEIGTEWTPGPPRGTGMLLNLENAETGLRLNLIVGAMPPTFVGGRGTGDIEKANYFAEPFVTRRMAFMKEFGRTLQKGEAAPREKARSLWEMLKLRLATAMVGRPEVLGSHVVNVLARPHFAYTYRLSPLLGPKVIMRKYSIVLVPPGADDGRHFEFTFTAGFAGSFDEFLRRIPRGESIVRSFQFVQGGS